MLKILLLKIDQRLGRLTEIFLIIIGIPFFTMLIVEVLSRKLINQSIFGVYEMAGYLSIWISMIGALLGYRNHELAKLTFLVKKLPSHWQKRVFVINQLLIMLALFLLALSGFLYINSKAVISQTSVSFNLPIFYFYLAIPLGLILMFFRTMLQLCFMENNLLNEEADILE